MPSFKLIKQLALDGTHTSFTSSDENMYFCVKRSKIELFDYKDWNLRNSKPSFEFKPKLSRVSDLLAMDGMLYLAGSDERDTIKVIKMEDVHELDKVLVIYKTKHKAYVLKLSKSSCGNVLLILHNKILLLSEIGDVMKTINLSFEIYNALQFDDKHFVVLCDDKVCFVDDSGKMTLIHHPHRSPSNEQYFLKYANCLAKDDCGNIYVGGAVSDIVVLDSDLNFVTSHIIGEIVSKIFYDEGSSALLVLAGKFRSSKLLMFR